MSEHRRHPDPSDPPSDIDAAAIASPASPTIAPAAPLIDTPARVLTHVLCSTLAQATFSATVFILPVIARKHFQAERWQVLIITMAPLVLATSSIFWGALLRRSSIRRYLLTYWAIAGVPLIGLAFVQSYWPLAILYIISSLGSAAWAAVNGELLNRLYPEGRRGRAYAYLSIGITAGGAALGLLVGKLLEHNPESFRWYIPALISFNCWACCCSGCSPHRSNASAREQPSGGASARRWSPSRTCARFSPPTASSFVMKPRS